MMKTESDKSHLFDDSRGGYEVHWSDNGERYVKRFAPGDRAGAENYRLALRIMKDAFHGC